MSASIASAAFRDALAQFASGVTIVTAQGASGPVGFTATGFTSVSLSPPLILVCINKTASAHDAVTSADHFGVNILDEKQTWVALQFARSGVDRFSGVPTRISDRAGVPLIDGALAHIECRNHARHIAGDHTILFGEVLSGAVGAGRPLLHFARQFGSLLPIT